MKKKHIPLSPGALMKAIDSPAGSDPMPVEHHEFPMKYPDDFSAPLAEFMSLIYSKTIRKGHRSPIAVDGAGKLYLIEHVAADRGWSLDWANRLFNEAIRCGFVRRGTGERNDFPPAGIVLQGRPKPQKTNTDGSTNDLVDTECTLRKLLSDDEYAQYEKLPLDERVKFEQEELAEAKTDKRILADAIWQARELNRQRHSTRLLRFCIQPDSPLPKRREKPPVVQLQLTLDDRSVHSVAEPGVNTPANGTVHSAVSLSGFPSGYSPSEDSSSSLRSSVVQSETTTSTTTIPAPAPNEAEDIKYLTEKMEFERDAAAQLLHACRVEDPTISVKVITRLAGHKQQQVFGRIRSGDIANVPGFMISAVPKMVHQPIRKTIEAQLLTERARAAGGD